MRIALATTTIHPPHALKLLRKYSADAKFFIAFDKNTDFQDSDWPSLSDQNASYLTPDWQGWWKCSSALGWNTIARRNLAFLEALKWGADLIISWDTDNYPIDKNYFEHFASSFKTPWNGIEVTGGNGWFDAGAYLQPPVRHRGYPIQKKHVPHYKPAHDRKIGVASGLIINDPDVDAVSRIESAPSPHMVSLLAQAGAIVDLHTWTVFNTQNTAVIRELVPAWFLMPNVGRMDDIYASLIVQRVARERGYHIHFGQPFALQQRHPHDLVKDLRAEIDGYDNVLRLAAVLDSIILPARSVIDDARIIYEMLCHVDFLPIASVNAGLVWLEDCAEVL